jgi:hypothetical protein
MTTKLKDLRAMWERECEVPAQAGGAGWLCVILKRKDRYAVIRYFTIGDRWVASCDVTDTKIPDVAMAQFAKGIQINTGEAPK